MKSPATSGFTLAELLITLAIIGILAVVAVPSYEQSLRKGRRSEARLLLADTAQRLERCYAECNSYVATACATPCPALPLASAGGDYEISAGNGTTVVADGFTLVATPVARRPQARDTACTSFSLTHLEAMSATGSDAAQCWQ